jgi:hypothetical protein
MRAGSQRAVDVVTARARRQHDVFAASTKLLHARNDVDSVGIGQ